MNEKLKPYPKQEIGDYATREDLRAHQGIFYTGIMPCEHCDMPLMSFRIVENNGESKDLFERIE